MVSMEDRGSWAIGGCLMIGIGVGLFLVRTNPMAMPASVMIGLGVGLLLGAFISKKKVKEIDQNKAE